MHLRPHTHYCAMRTKWEQRVNGKVHRSELLALFVQRFTRTAEFMRTAEH